MRLDSAGVIAFLLNAAVQATVVAGGTAIALRLVRHARARVQYGTAIAGLVLCAAVPLVFAWPSAAAESATTVITPPINTTDLASTRITFMLMCAYLASLAWRGVTLARAGLTIIRLRRDSTRITNGPIHESFRNSDAPWLGIELWRSSRARTPLVCGIRQPAIVFPESFEGSDRAVIDAVIAHECAHVTRRDIAMTLLIEVLTAPLALHPAVAALKRAAAKYREAACDEVAVARLRMRPRRYASLLLRLAEFQARTAVAFAPGAAADLEARVRDLVAPRRHRRIGVATGMLAVAFLIASPAIALLCPIAVDVGWREISGVWTLDVAESRPHEGVPFRSATLRIEATRDAVDIAHQRTRRDGRNESFEIRRATDDVPSSFTLPDGLTVSSRARWDGNRFVTNSAAPANDWREHVEAVATGDRLIIRAENVTKGNRRRYEFVYRKDLSR